MILVAWSKIIPSTTPGLLLKKISPIDPNENETIAILANQDGPLEKLVFQAAFRNNFIVL